jgi:multisubunit Na+/H+ antiporter MnhE subunit
MVTSVREQLLAFIVAAFAVKGLAEQHITNSIQVNHKLRIIKFLPYFAVFLQDIEQAKSSLAATSV